jgi:prephenate dehydrogenase
MIQSIRVVGAGLIGTSIGLKMKSLGCKVEIIDTDTNSMKLAQDLVKSEKLSEPELIIIAVSVDANAKVVIEQINNNPKSIVCDLASVKSDLLLQVDKLSAHPENFVSLHPMAGREVNGAENSRADLFEGRAWIGISDSLKNKKNNKIIESFVSGCGGVLYWLTSKEHDDTVALLSHLPQILSSLLASKLNDVDPNKLNLAGQGLRDVTRLAASDAKLWAQILTSNKDSIQPLLEDFIASLTKLQDSLNSTNQDQVAAILNRGITGKARIPGKHGAKNRDYTFLPIVIDDKPGQLASIFNECAKVDVNIEDLSIEHSPGQETGLITLSLSAQDCEKLSEHLISKGFRVHPTKNR